MSELTAQFELCYPLGATIRAEFSRPAAGFSVTALFGPSGCGKTTVLRSLAGLERPQQGTIALGSDVWLDSRRGIYRAPAERNVGFLFQEYALFPHLTVAQNVGYGLRRQATSERKRMVHELLDRFGLGGLEQRYPQEVSGGQQQRVALARTLARQPRLLLLDEPLSALDTLLREQMRLELRSLLTDFAIPMFLVTHDRHEAIALADHLIVMDEGHILQSGPVAEVFSRPGDERVARMVGVETVQPGRIVGRSNGTVAIETGGTRLTALANGVLDEDVLVCIRAEDVEIAAAPGGLDDAANRLSATIGRIAPDAVLVRLDLDCGFGLAALVPRPTVKSLNLEVGSVVTVHLPAATVHLIPQSRRKTPN
jgi:molybdate transport system ATP-binding protein